MIGRRTGRLCGTAGALLALVSVPSILFAQTGSAAAASATSGGQPALAGQLLWRAVTSGAIEATPALGHDGIVYVPSADRRLYALYPDGLHKWALHTGGRLRTPPAIAADATIYVANDRGSLLAVRPNGVVRWRAELPEPTCAGPAVTARGGPLVATCDGQLVAYDSAGTVRWRHQLSAGAPARPALGSDGTIYIGSADRRLHAIAPDGDKRWELTLPAVAGAPAIGADGTVYVAAAGVAAVTPTGTLLWHYSIPGGVADPVIGPAATLLVGARNGRLYALSPQGERLWERPLGGEIRHAAAVTADGTTMVATADGALHAVDAAGAALWRFPLRGTPAAPMVDPRGGLYVGTDDWILYRVAGGAGALLDGPWPAVHGGAAQTSRVPENTEYLTATYALLTANATFPAVERKLFALDYVDELLTGVRPLSLHVADMEQLLEYLAREGVTVTDVDVRPTAADYPLVRMRAGHLLGEVATDRSLQILLDMVRDDPRTEVRRSALEAIGRVGVDARGTAVRAIAALLARPQLAIDQIAETGSAVTALAGIARINGGFADPAGYRALLTVATDPQLPRWLQSRASDALLEAVQHGEEHAP